MKIILDDYEAEVIASAAREYNVNIEGIIDSYVVQCESNFEQDINDLMNESAEQIRLDYGEEEK